MRLRTVERCESGSEQQHECSEHGSSDGTPPHSVAFDRPAEEAGADGANGSNQHQQETPDERGDVTGPEPDFEDGERPVAGLHEAEPDEREPEPLPGRA